MKGKLGIGFDTFQFTPLREGRPASISRTTHFATFQFTPLREGRPERRDAAVHVRGFQFTPLREGRLEPGEEEAVPAQFQFTPLREGRPQSHTDTPSNSSISIHAPPRGATSPAAGKMWLSAYFNSRPSARGDLSLAELVVSAGFQFTPLREGRQQKICNFCKSFVQPLQISMA